jgi:hypothetical protein
MILWRKIVIVFPLITILGGCATIYMLPESVQEVDFDSREGKTGWSKYEQVQRFRDTDPKILYDAIKVGLGDAGFALRRADFKNGVVIGEHSITWEDWNSMAGVYFKQDGKDTLVKVIIEGSKDIGFSGDQISDGYSGKILKGIRLHLNQTRQAVLKVDRKDISYGSRERSKQNDAMTYEDKKKQLLDMYLKKEITKEEYFELRRELDKTK